MKMKIGDITEIIDGDRGKNYPKKSDFKDEGFCLFLNTGNVTSDGFVFKKNDFISEEKSNKLRKGKLERGDLVFTTRGTVGNVAYYSDNIPYDHVRINSGMVIFRVFEKKVFNKFLYQILKHKNSRIYIRQYCTGSAQPQLPIMNLRNIELNIPPLETQYKIARILLAYDDLIENNERQIKLLEEAARRLYKEWFVDLHFPGYEDVEIVAGVPEGWKWTPFSDAFDYIRGRSYTSKQLVEQGGIMMANLKNIDSFGGYKRRAEKRYIGNYKDDQILHPGDIVMGVTDMTKERRLVGHVAFIPDLGEEMTFSMDLIKLIPKLVTHSYLYSAMRFGYYSRNISQLANGVNVLHLKPDSMMNMEMLIPSTNVMNKYELIFDAYNNRIDLLEKQIEFAKEARDRLLPKLMSGEIEV